MKKLSKDEMKMVMGGSNDEFETPPGDDDGGGVEKYGTCCYNGDCGGVGCAYWTTCNYTFTKC